MTFLYFSKTNNFIYKNFINKIKDNDLLFAANFKRNNVPTEISVASGNT